MQTFSLFSDLRSAKRKNLCVPLSSITLCNQMPPNAPLQHSSEMPFHTIASRRVATGPIFFPNLSSSTTSLIFSKVKQFRWSVGAPSKPCPSSICDRCVVLFTFDPEGRPGGRYKTSRRVYQPGRITAAERARRQHIITPGPPRCGLPGWAGQELSSTRPARRHSSA